jgi:hypothetical protein
MHVTARSVVSKHADLQNAEHEKLLAKKEAVFSVQHIARRARVRTSARCGGARPQA